MTNDGHIAQTDHPVHELISRRWSPYGFSMKPVSPTDLRSLFEAARWAPSSFNEQPWAYVVAIRDEPEEHERLVSCLTEGNRSWARQAPVLAVAVARQRFARNDKLNRTASHDVGLATANLVVEATARGLLVHQMAGVLLDRVRELYGVPDGWEPLTALTIGYAADPDEVPAELRQRDARPRTRKPLRDFVFASAWGRASRLIAVDPEIR